MWIDTEVASGPAIQSANHRTGTIPLVAPARSRPRRLSQRLPGEVATRVLHRHRVDGALADSSLQHPWDELFDQIRIAPFGPPQAGLHSCRDVPRPEGPAAREGARRPQGAKHRGQGGSRAAQGTGGRAGRRSGSRDRSRGDERLGKTEGGAGTARLPTHFPHGKPNASLREAAAQLLVTRTNREPKGGV